MTQLSLIDTPTWRLDERTRQVGRAGIARARAALCAGLSGTAPDRAPIGRGRPPGRSPDRRPKAGDHPSRRTAA